MDKPLFYAENIYLAALDPARDAETLSRWTHDPDFAHAFDRDPFRPLSPHQVKKKLDEAEKNPSRSTEYRFAIRAKVDDRLVGLVSLIRIEWSNGNAWLTLEMGSSQDGERSYGCKALQLIIHYAFAELNLHRISMEVLSDSSPWMDALQKEGFVIEVRQREAIYRRRQRRDVLVLGLLREEWAGMSKIGVQANG